MSSIHCLAFGEVHLPDYEDCQCQIEMMRKCRTDCVIARSGSNAKTTTNVDRREENRDGLAISWPCACSDISRHACQCHMHRLDRASLESFCDSGTNLGRRRALLKGHLSGIRTTTSAVSSPSANDPKPQMMLTMTARPQRTAILNYHLLHHNLLCPSGDKGSAFPSHQAVYADLVSPYSLTF